MLPTDARLTGELWLVLPTLLFDALVEDGELDGNVLVVSPDVYEELDWPKVRAAFGRAGYSVVVLVEKEKGQQRNADVE